MVGKALVMLAIAVWAFVVGSLLLQSPPPAAARAGAAAARPAPASPAALAGLPFRSVSMQLHRTDWMHRYRESIDEIADLGADTVKFVVDPRMEHGESNIIFLDLRRTPTPQALKDLIGHARGRGLRVILMPIVLLDAPRKATEWRGTIKPENWDLWWESYTAVMTHFAWIAEASGVDLLVVGSELVSTERQEDNWRRLIAHIRGIFRGKLTYSANWDHYVNVPFWDALDLIGMNSYWSLDQGRQHEAEVSDIMAAWREIQADLLPFAADQGKPIIFLEAGWCSLSNAAHEPWDYTRVELEVDKDLQRRLYEGFLQTWIGHPQLGGFSIWEWTPTPDPEDRDALEATLRGYTPEGKPAEAVLREHLARGPWTVDPSAAMGVLDRNTRNNHRR